VAPCLSEDELALPVLVEELAGKPGDLLHFLLQDVLERPVVEAVAVPLAATQQLTRTAALLILNKELEEQSFLTTLFFLIF